MQNRTFGSIPGLQKTLELGEAIFSPEMILEAVPQCRCIKFERFFTVPCILHIDAGRGPGDNASLGCHQHLHAAWHNKAEGFFLNITWKTMNYLFLCVDDTFSKFFHLNLSCLSPRNCFVKICFISFYISFRFSQFRFV
jgi:hypothetical protein